MPPIIPEACSTDFAVTLGKKAPFQAAFYFGTGLVVLNSADVPFGPGPLAAGAQCFSGMPSFSQAAPDEAPGTGRLQAPAAQIRGPNGQGERGAACAEGAASSGCIAPASSPAVASQGCHGSSPLLLSPEGCAMEVCVSSGGRRGSHNGNRRASLYPADVSAPGGTPGQQHRLGGLTPLIGRSIEKLRRSWGSGSGQGGHVAKELLLGAAAAAAGAAREAGEPFEGNSSSAAGDPDMQPLMHGHVENLCPNSGSAAAAKLVGAPLRSPLGEIHLHEGVEAAPASWGAQRATQHAPQQHRLARAGGLADHTWAAAASAARDSGAAMHGSGAVPVADAGEGAGRLAQLHAVMHMSCVDASVDGSAIHSEAAQLVRGCGVHMLAPCRCTIKASAAPHSSSVESCALQT